MILLTSCSSTQFGYRFLDNLMRWELNKYVRLNSQQSQEINTALDTFHTWHRSSQIPLYSEFLSQQIKILERPSINAAQLQQVYDRTMLFWQASARRMTPDLAQLISTLDDNQLQQLQNNMDEKNREFDEEHILPSQKEREQNRQERMLKSLKKWIGEPTEAQTALVEQWAGNLSFETTARLEQRKVMRERFDKLLTTREQLAQTQQQLNRLMANPAQNWTPAYRRYLQLNRQKTYQLMISLHASLNTEQKQKLLKKLEGYRRDFDKLTQG